MTTSEPKKKNLDFLWKSFFKGDDKSFSLIYQQHIDGLFLYGLKFCSDRELAHDWCSKKLTLNYSNNYEYELCIFKECIHPARYFYNLFC
jgi:hypothetical protein